MASSKSTQTDPSWTFFAKKNMIAQEKIVPIGK
jgi:hypothetical protein